MWGLCSAFGSSALFRHRLRSREDWGLRLPTGRIKTHACLVFLRPSHNKYQSNNIFLFFRSQHCPLYQEAWAQDEFLKLGKRLFNLTPSYPRYHKSSKCIFHAGYFWVISISLSHGTFGPNIFLPWGTFDSNIFLRVLLILVHFYPRVLLIQSYFSLSGYFWFCSHG